ncbi:hypothetical protein [Pseudoalteromonas ruthenica]|uniref:hypothetical protein n=1 Tax=Pseudoalteromonas ruthenica TaxID=151081 RepID=UPI00110A3939|nr:hypothetical protein [Pseudoalteromonas ruthenica]TMP23802.1 hypothetical protein CWC06_09625 [Pseudoalteromonas ruthenica]
MFNSFSQLYNELLEVTAEHSVFSYQVVICFLYLSALAWSLIKARRGLESFSNFITISVVSAKYILTTLLMEFALVYVQEEGIIGNVQNVYLALSLSNLLAIFACYKLHKHLSYTFSALYFTAIKMMAILFFANLALWVKFVLLDIQEGLVFLHYAFSFLYWYTTISLAIVMFFPAIILTRIGVIVGLSLSYRYKNV